MSPASKSKSKDKRVAGKEPQKSSTKPTSIANTGGGVPTSGYNPLLGTFHALETEDHLGNSVGMGVEYDSVSNNGSWSGESEDHKEKNTQGSSRQETTAPGADNDKREKIRQKNEKKHQRQKERRAQELHERCSGYLMSRKLEGLAQQLVAMGFSSERATMALILNEGKVEQSVAWLFEGGEDADNQREPNNLDGGGNLKIDISEELAQITEMEMKFKCSKQEVERAIVACEGDLEQAAETLKNQKQEQPPAAPPKLEENGDPLTIANGNGKIMSYNSSMTSRTQSKAIYIQQRTDDNRDFNYTKMGVTVGPSSVDPGIKSLQLLKKIPPNSDWTKQQVVTSSVEKRWPVGGSNSSVSYSLTSPLQAAPPPAKIDSRFANIGTELKNLQLGSVREPVIMMQRPKSKNIPMSVSSSLSASVADWNPNVVDPVMYMNTNGFQHGPATTKSFNTSSHMNSVSNGQMYDHFHYQQQQQQQPHLQHQYASSSAPLDHHFSQQGSMNHYNNGGMWNRMVGSTTTTTTPTLAPASSLGLFSGLGSNGCSGPSSPVDWNTCDSLQFDYTNIDWSLDRLPLPPSSSPRTNGMWMSSTNSVDHYALGRGGKTSTRPPTGIMSNRNNGISVGGLHPDGVGAVGSETSAGGSRDWSSPFEEKELFSFPRQFVSSPSL
ncbi:UBA-like protein [Tanacetum coccineum]